jgi:predicted kinase
MQTVIILRGAPGCGKTTWASKYCDKHNTFITLSIDALKDAYKQYESDIVDKYFKKLEFLLLRQALDNDLDVIIDDENFSTARIEMFIEIVNKYIKAKAEKGQYVEVNCYIKDFKTPLHICLLRNSMKEVPLTPKKVCMTYRMIKRKKSI